MSGEHVHVSVLRDQTIELLRPGAGKRLLDGTLGFGGHAEAWLEACGEGGAVLGLDRDEEALEYAKTRLARFGEHVVMRRTAMSDFETALAAEGASKGGVFDAVLADLGVSSLHLDKAERGFSFRADGPLDMRMDRSADLNAAELVNDWRLERIRDVIAELGEEPLAARIARFIGEARERARIETTAQLAGIVEAAYPAKMRRTARNHPATRTFQAIRMAVNDELGELERFLTAVVERLKPGGRLAIISFHSLEDRMVKHFFRAEAADCVCPKSLPRCVCRHRPRLQVVTKKPVLPTPVEAAENPRARSAKLRVAERTDA